MSKRNLVARLLLTAAIAMVCVWVWPDSAESKDPDRSRREPQKDRVNAEYTRTMENVTVQAKPPTFR
ncbi:MAG: hypothetical protein QGH94_06080 [Phycisphaerae bacterium]|mgnify:CR=1 FL=1|jgi:hypothetical protein|nr:hypothetical protein [Phycisphaerae bacterium]MDP7287541.1 hypothetical protein [Phycisphaerae bacterium]